MFISFCFQLLNTVAGIDTWKNSVAMITLDWSQPYDKERKKKSTKQINLFFWCSWNMMDSLKRWLGVLESHVSQFDPVVMAELKKSSLFEYGFLLQSRFFVQMFVDFFPMWIQTHHHV